MRNAFAIEKGFVPLCAGRTFCLFRYLSKPISIGIAINFKSLDSTNMHILKVQGKIEELDLKMLLTTHESISSSIIMYILKGWSLIYILKERPSSQHEQCHVSSLNYIYTQKNDQPSEQFLSAMYRDFYIIKYTYITKCRVNREHTDKYIARVSSKKAPRQFRMTIFIKALHMSRPKIQ